MKSFLLSLLLNMAINIYGLIPAVVFLILHFAIGCPLWPALAAFGLWVLGIVVYMLLIGWGSKCANEPVVRKENKNPYSAKSFPGISDRKDTGKE